MDFGYLSEFWDAITSETADTVAWFQSLGNAVGGAVGSVVLAIFHPLMDVIFLLYYVLIVLSQIVGNLLKFAFWIWDVFYNFITYIDLVSSISVYPSGALTALKTIGLWSSLMVMVSVLLVVYMVKFIYEFAKH